MAYSPRLLGQPAKPSQIGEKLAKTWDILSPYVTGPVDAWKGLMEADLNTLLYDNGAGGRKAVEDAFNVAGTVTGGSSVVPKPSNSVGIFGGRLAATADQAALAKAEKMAAEGSSRDDIWNSTGWFQGADNQWRFEIPDNKSFFRALPMPDRPPGDTVGRQLIHDQLYAAYPEAADIGLRWMNTKETRPGQVKGLYSEGQIDLFGSRDASSTLLHELQHDIQRREGFAPGGNTFALKPGTPAWEIYKERLAAMSKPLPVEVFQKAAGFDTLEDAKKAYPGYLKQLKKKDGMADKAAQEYAVQNAYLRNAGEVEARNVQKRLDMTPEQRRASPPWETQEYPFDMQFIVKR